MKHLNLLALICLLLSACGNKTSQLKYSVTTVDGTTLTLTQAEFRDDIDQDTQTHGTMVRMMESGTDTKVKFLVDFSKVQSMVKADQGCTVTMDNGSVRSLAVSPSNQSSDTIRGYDPDGNLAKIPLIKVMELRRL